jgi:hypothetical protein
MIKPVMNQVFGATCVAVGRQIRSLQVLFGALGYIIFSTRAEKQKTLNFAIKIRLA